MKKQYRILKSQEFQSLIHGQNKYANSSFVAYIQPKKFAYSRIGISLSKKIGNAVIRNKIKRQVRMMCQELVDFEQSKYDLILIVRFNYKDFDYATNKNTLKKLLIKVKMNTIDIKEKL